ncbi:MAG: class C beta-lactamase-related serine hydrolase [Spirochaetales bacterium]|nr:MAG: class C beta-lactamase-related serine hydrolase [Spirochaetales bacterium]
MILHGGRIIIITIILVIFFNGCAGRGSKQATSAPAAREVSGKELFGAAGDLVRRENIQAFLVFRSGEYLWEQYAEDMDPEEIHVINSCTKSIVSLLIGTLFDRGLLDTVDTPVYTFFPEIAPEELTERSKSLTLRHFLTMSTGLASRDSYLYRWEGLRAVWNKKDWIRHIVSLPSEAPGGQRFDYSNLASYLLGEIIRQKTGMDAEEYALKTLFVPLGITEYSWEKNPLGRSTGWGGLRLKPRDLVKIGQLVLDRGRWQGRQLISEDWIEQSTRPWIKAGTLREYYGYQWWVDGEGRIMALGYEGQYLIVDTVLKLVTVFASSLREEDFFLPYEIYTAHVVPAAEKW